MKTIKELMQFCLRENVDVTFGSSPDAMGPIVAITVTDRSSNRHFRRLMTMQSINSAWEYGLLIHQVLNEAIYCLKEVPRNEIQNN